MSLDQIISITVTRATTQPSRAGFGVPLIAGYFPTSLFSERTRSYSSLTALEGDGFVSTDPIYLQMEAILSQNPSPPLVKVGRRALPPSQVLEVTPTDLDTAAGGSDIGAVHKVTITGYADSAFGSRAQVVDTASYTAVTDDTATLICNGLRTALTPTGDYAEGGTATLTITASNTTMSGLIFGVEYTVDGKTRGVDDITAAQAGTDLATDLGNIQTYDSDWFGLCIDSNSQEEIEAAASWAQTNKKLFVAQTQDNDVADVAVSSDTTSVAAVLKANSYTGTMLFYHRNNLDMVSGAMLGRALPTTPGSINWAYQQLAGVQAQDLTDTQLNILQASVGNPTGGKDVNTVTSLNDISVTRYGTSMQGEFIDIYRYALYLEARLGEDVFGALVNNVKIPMSDAGIQAIRGVILARLEEGITIGALLADPAPTVTVPRASEIPAGDRLARLLDNVTFRAQLAQAINFVEIAGELNA